ADGRTRSEVGGDLRATIRPRNCAAAESERGPGGIPAGVSALREFLEECGPGSSRDCRGPAGSQRPVAERTFYTPNSSGSLAGAILSSPNCPPSSRWGDL